MTPVDVLARLDDRFRLLSGSRRGLERHQTLRQVVQWSYDQALSNRSVNHHQIDLQTDIDGPQRGARRPAVPMVGSRSNRFGSGRRLGLWSR